MVREESRVRRVRHCQRKCANSSSAFFQDRHVGGTCRIGQSLRRQHQGSGVWKSENKDKAQYLAGYAGLNILFPMPVARSS